MRLNLPVTNCEVDLCDGKTIVSTTDLKGKITYANPYFIEICGYTEQELIGAPHNILRHPDMPVEAYADLWGTLKSGLPWSGIVKNRCKNGDYYWVVANVTPVVEKGRVTGYMSVRTKPSRTQVESAAALYKEIKAGNPNKIGICQGKPVSTRVLSRLLALKNVSLARRIDINMSILALLCTAMAINACLSGPLLATMSGGAIAVVLALSFWRSLYACVVKPLKDATHAAKIMAGGDMTTLLEVGRRDEVGQLQLLLRQLNINLSSIIGDVRSNFQQIVASTCEVSRGNLDLAERTESQASSLEETSASMEQLTSSVEQNADNTKEVDQLAIGATAIAERTGSAVAQVAIAMQEINASSARIADIIGLIDGIAFQTNILALNAAVEAARAGEQGRGFAVVAGEVRGLAQRSSTAAKEIRTLIGVSAEKVNAGSAVANEACRNMGEMMEAIRQVAAIMNEIRCATVEQSAGIGQVKDAILQMDEVTQQNAAMVEEAAASACVLQDQALAIANALKVFKLRAGTEFTHASPPVAKSAMKSDRAALRIVHNTQGRTHGAKKRLAGTRISTRTKVIANGTALAALEA